MRALPRLLSPTLVALALATPALADLTARDVWHAWQTMGDTTGKRLSAAGETDGDGTLSLRDVAVSLDLVGGQLTGTVPRIDLTEQPDGSVAIALSPRHDLRLVLDNGALDLPLVAETPGLTMHVSGTPEHQTHTVTAPRITLTAGAITSNGAPLDATLSLALVALSARSDLTGGPEARFFSTFAATTLALDLAARDRDAPGRGFALTGKYRNLTGDISGDATHKTAALSHGGGTLSLRQEEPGQVPLDLALTSKAAHLSSSLRDGTLEQTGRATGIGLSARGGLLPMAELPARIDTLGWTLRLPVASGDTAGDVSLQLDIGGAMLDPAFWSTLDPTGAFPQEPGTLHVDLDGTAQVPTAPPGAAITLHSLVLKALRLSLAGVDVTGEGAFRFDPAQPGPLSGPDGTLDLTLTGTGALLTKLVQMGLIPGDQAMGAQFILGLFTAPRGDDQVGTTLTFTPDGRISANGQRVQ